MRRLGLVWLTLATACGSGASTTKDAATDGCALAADTASTSTVVNGCTLLTRDTRACTDERTAAGLGGAWLQFSCRVQLTKVNRDGKDYVQVTTDGRPDYRSNYFLPTDACYQRFTPEYPNPNRIVAQNLVLLVPLAPDGEVHEMGGGSVGVALNGVPLFDNAAAPGDDIYLESKSFDPCQGHPQEGGVYHYHSEPYAITHDDEHLVGVLRDGYFLYGRRDADGSVPADLDAAGGHVGTTPDSATPVYHHHLNLQTSTTPGTAGQMVWFATTGKYGGTPGSCTGCQ